MQRIAVESSNVASVGYDEKVMEVEFKNGGVYQYFQVEREIFDAMLASNSKGQFLNKIKGNYMYRKVS